MADKGVGRDIGVLSVCPVTFRKVYICIFSLSPSLICHTQPDQDVMSAGLKEHEEKEGSSFARTIKSRMIVQQVVDRVEGSAAFTFDYCSMLVVASLIAAGGLATDNSVIVVASMLVSPLMGPVLASYILSFLPFLPSFPSFSSV